MNPTSLRSLIAFSLSPRSSKRLAGSPYILTHDIRVDSGLTHNSWRLAPPTFDLNLDFVMPQGPILSGNSLSIPIQVSNLDSQATNLYGLAFSVKYSTRQLDSARVKVSLKSAYWVKKG